MTIIRAMTGTALVLGLGACYHPIWWASEMIAFRKDGEIEHQRQRYSFEYASRSGSRSNLVPCTSWPRINGEIMMIEVADMGSPVLSVNRLDGPDFTCQDIENWKDTVYPIAAKACRSINQTPLSSKKDRNVYLTEDGSVEIWDMCI